MRLLSISLLALIGPGAAFAAVLECTVPAANVARAQELCELLRQDLRVRSTEWDNDICASAFLRIGLLQGERIASRRVASATVATAVNDAVTDFEATWVKPAQAICGDGTLDTEEPFNEACDDGNNTNGDGCDESCVVE